MQTIPTIGNVTIVAWRERSKMCMYIMQFQFLFHVNYFINAFSYSLLHCFRSCCVHFSFRYEIRFYFITFFLCLMLKNLSRSEWERTFARWCIECIFLQWNLLQRSVYCVGHSILLYILLLAFYFLNDASCVNSIKISNKINPKTEPFCMTFQYFQFMAQCWTSSSTPFLPWHSNSFINAYRRIQNGKCINFINKL